MQAKDDVTIYNRSIDPLTHAETWTRHSLCGVTWEDRKAARPLHADMIPSPEVIVYIPQLLRGDYLNPLAFQALFNKNGFWTLQLGDVLVRGLVEDEISPDFSIHDLKRKYDDVLVIRSIDSRDNGSLALRHWQVGSR